MPDWIIRPYTAPDASKVADLISICYGEKATPPHIWQWRHFGYDSDRSNTLVAVSGEKVVGLRPMEIYDFMLRGERVTAGIFSGVMVHPDFRRQGLFTALVAKSEELSWQRDASFVTTMPNHRSYPGFIKRGYIDPGRRQLLVFPLQPFSLVGTRAGPLRTMLSPLSRLDRLISPALKITARNRTVAAHSGEFGAEYLQLAQRHASILPGLVMLREPRWLTWRFRESPWHDYQAFEARDAHGGLEGYAVTTSEAREQLRVAYVVDVLATSRRRTRHLIRRCVSHQADAGNQLVMAVISNHSLMVDFVASGFIPVPSRISPKQFYTVVRPNPDRAAELQMLDKISNWYLTLADWDTI